MVEFQRNKWEKIHLVETYERLLLEQGFAWYMDEVNEVGPCIGLSDLNYRHHFSLLTVWLTSSRSEPPTMHAQYSPGGFLAATIIVFPQ